jgi:phosphotransferase system enzyme I (PtsP)
MPGRRVIFRTLDIGSDKVHAYREIAGEPKLQLGLRSIRFELRHPEQFRQRMRAILWAGADTERLGIMSPMISSLDEFTRARKLVMEGLHVLQH